MRVENSSPQARRCTKENGALNLHPKVVAELNNPGEVVSLGGRLFINEGGKLVPLPAGEVKKVREIILFKR